MAFDLVKLQILQEALDTLKSRHSWSFAGGYMCSCLSHSISVLSKSPTCDLFSVVPELYKIIENSVELRKLTIRSFSSRDPMIINQQEALCILNGYLWSPSSRHKKDRIKYLERLIEDEMSGTYFIQGDNYGI